MEIFGIDVGGSGIKGAPVNIESGELLTERHRIPTPKPATPEAVAGIVAELVAHFDWKGKVGCGFPSVVQKGVVKTASNIDKSWIGTNANELFSQKSGCEVKVLNDADVAGMAEMRFGSGANEDGVVVLITVGTGLGTVIFSNGQLVPNTELGHVQLHGKEAELFASDAVRKHKDLSWKQWAKRFDEYLHELEKLVNPDLIIVGGGASKKQHKFGKYLTIQTPIQMAELRNNAGIVGAAIAAGL